MWRTPMGDVEVGTVEEPRVTAIPLLPCASLDGVVSFYIALGFEVTVRQERPNPYAAIRWRGADVHLYEVASHDVQRGNICLLIVSEVEGLHACFCDALRGYLGRVPRSGLPRITRMRPGQTRFTVVDPAGNSVIYIRRGETNPHDETRRMSASLSHLGKAIRNAEVLREFKNDDVAAARVLKAAIARANDPAPHELAVAAEMLAELEADR
jgi:hypothetical protein